MKIKNINGEVTLSPKEQEKEKHRKDYEALRTQQANEAPSLAKLKARIEALEKHLGL
jgi:capsule polysaccharide export protein KpsE/RkpR